MYFNMINFIVPDILISMQRLCEIIDHKIDEGFFTPYAKFLNWFIKQLGATLVYVVYIITFFLSFTSFAIILPYEQLYKSTYLLAVLSCIGVYLLINIMFHYWQARTLKPVSNPGKEGDRWCYKCNFFKSDRTHHCGVCERCILGMDHHCIWINQCVGSHNHRNFFLFIANLTAAAFIIIIAGFNTFYDHVYMTAEKTYCTAALEMAPLQVYICYYDGFARNSIIFGYLLSVLLFILVGILTSWNCYLISRGFTYIDYLKQAEAMHKHSYFKTSMDKGLVQNWRNFCAGTGRSSSTFSYLPVSSDFIR